MAGRWDRAYCRVPAGAAPAPYADTITYQRGAEWLAGCAQVEDWGCGLGFLRHFVEPERYRGIDGSHSPFADEVADLAQYRSSVEGIFMRHVLEHNRDWAMVLDNAVASFTRRMALILFTPMGEVTRQIAPWDNGPDYPGVPNISFSHEDLTARFGPAAFTFADISPSGTFYGCERIYYLERHA